MTFSRTPTLSNRPTVLPVTATTASARPQKQEMSKGRHTIPPNFPTRNQRRTLQRGRSLHTDNAPIPTLVTLSTLPAPSSMHLLMVLRLLEPFSSSCALLHARTTSLYGRASLVELLVPYDVAACNQLAAWI